MNSYHTYQNKNLYKPNAEAARLYSCDRLVENTPMSSVQRLTGCSELYKSAATRNLKVI